MGENDTPHDRNFVPINRSLGNLFIPSLTSYYLGQVQLLVQLYCIVLFIDHIKDMKDTYTNRSYGKDRH